MLDGDVMTRCVDERQAKDTVYSKAFYEAT